MRILAVTVILVCLGQTLYAQRPASASRQQERPKWYEVTGNGFTSGSMCLVRSAANHQTVGQVEPGYRFLAFGKNSSWITFAYKGSMAYIPAQAATELYPDSTPSSEWKSAGQTLEQRLAASRERSKSGPLAPSFSNSPTPKPSATPVAGAAGKNGAAGTGGSFEAAAEQGAGK